MNVCARDPSSGRDDRNCRLSINSLAANLGRQELMLIFLSDIMTLMHARTHSAEIVWGEAQVSMKDSKNVLEYRVGALYDIFS